MHKWIGGRRRDAGKEEIEDIRSTEEGRLSINNTEK